MQVPPNELKAILKYQIAAIKGMTESLGGQLVYVKPHGALYNTAASSREETAVIIDAIHSIDPQLALMGLAGSVVEMMAKEQQIPFIAEAFADRKYTADGRLQSRQMEGAVIHDPQQSAAQVLSIIQKQQVISASGTIVPIIAQSVCIHGDNPAAVAILKAIREVIGSR